MSNDKVREVQKTAGEGATGAMSDFVRETTRPGAATTDNLNAGAATRSGGALSGTLDFSLNDPLSPSRIGNDFGFKPSFGQTRVAEATPLEQGAQRINKAAAGIVRDAAPSPHALHTQELRDAFAENRLPKLTEIAKRADDAKTALDLLGKDSASRADLQGLLDGKLKGDPRDPRTTSAVLNDRDSVKRLLDGFDTSPVSQFKEGGSITRAAVKDEGSERERADNARFSVTRALRLNDPQRALNDASLKELIRSSFDKKGVDGVGDALEQLQEGVRVGGRKLDADGNPDGKGMTLRVLDVPENQPTAAEARAGGYRYDENHKAYVRTLAERKFDFDVMGR